MMVLMLTLALLLVSILYCHSVITNGGSAGDGPEPEQELEEEITGTDVDFSTYDEMKTAYEAGESPLWFYLR
ncbi:MAG: hypothetical protein ACLVJO_15115 [[Clostridium] scindens]